MRASAAFEYAEITLPHDCLLSLWALTLSENEWGGRLDVSQCKAKCDVELVEGTVIKKRAGPESELYLGKDKAYSDKGKLKPIKLASVYIPWHKYSEMGDCGNNGVNLIFHTHPLLLTRDQETKVARIALPSMGDIFVHCVLANIESYKKTGNAVMTVVMAFEGLYKYSILPHKFRQVYDKYNSLVAGGKTEEEAEAQLRTETFDELRPSNQQFFKVMKKHCDENRDKYATDGAPDIRNGMWHEKGKAPSLEELDFPFAKHLGSKMVVDMARNNPFTHGLICLGFHCEFIPAPYQRDLQLLAPSKITMLDSRKAT